jgi:DNA invertase Pin-like site-specific DNA recombinase
MAGGIVSTAANAQSAYSVPALGCAIYTRKSSEEGLEQDFNSLHAQREACEAFVLSQKGLGWTPIATAYDDGGFSGGNVERPALKRLIADIEAGQVKVIVVYKVDRLTRSLADFAKLVELFDTMGVSFVSVTQQFNTTTSMGRLTLNVLLSFAQFEREVTGERIRDKIAASKRKGMWMGGVPPAGYCAVGRALEPEPVQAERIPEMYRLYLQLNCVRRLCKEVRERGWLTPERTNKRSGFGGHKPFSRGHLHRILSNPLYAGLVHHHGEHHPGQHLALVSMDLWKQVQERLEKNRQGHKVQSRAQSPSLLSGKLFDEAGRRLIPSHTTKGKKRYRYYVTPVDDPGDPIRLPAVEIEREVIGAIVNWASNQQQVLDATGWADAPQAAQVLKQAQLLKVALQQRPQADESVSGARAPAAPGSLHVRSCVSRVEVAPASMRISLDLVGCGLVKEVEGTRQSIIEIPIERKRCGMAVRLVIGNEAPVKRPLREPDPGLVSLMVRGKAWLKLLTTGGQSIETIAEKQRLSARYVSRVINVALLAPDIVQALERGEHPIDLNATKLITSVPFPMDWVAQRQLLGIGKPEAVAP